LELETESRTTIAVQSTILVAITKPNFLSAVIFAGLGDHNRREDRRVRVTLELERKTRATIPIDQTYVVAITVP